MTIKYSPHISFKGDQRGSGHSSLSLVLFVMLVFAVIGVFKNVSSHADTNITQIKSGISGYCLDDKSSIAKNNAEVDLYNCNGSSAQGWQFNDTNLMHSGFCLGVSGNSISAGAGVNLENCNVNNPGQVWLVTGGEIYNPNSTLCLSSSGYKTGSGVEIASCNNTQNETWQTNWSMADCPAETKGQKIACAAISDWVDWHKTGSDHNALLNTYTDGAPYEEWCADFVSYVYKQAGYPFTQGETNGWDENNANNIQNMGFTMHSLNSYSPQIGDVAYYNYSGGHVEIVISGGKTPTFLYGNSATIDPTTGNGQMEANTITNDGDLGSLEYYLSPN